MTSSSLLFPLPLRTCVKSLIMQHSTVTHQPAHLCSKCSICPSHSSAAHLSTSVSAFSFFHWLLFPCLSHRLRTLEMRQLCSMLLPSVCSCPGWQHIFVWHWRRRFLSEEDQSPQNDTFSSCSPLVDFSTFDRQFAGSTSAFLDAAHNCLWQNLITHTPKEREKGNIL